MLTVWLGAILVFLGLLLMVTHPIWRGRLSTMRQTNSAPASATLEPRKPAAGFDPKEHWLGIALFALGGILLLVRAIF